MNSPAQSMSQKKHPNMTKPPVLESLLLQFRDPGALTKYVRELLESYGFEAESREFLRESLVATMRNSGLGYKRLLVIDIARKYCHFS